MYGRVVCDACALYKLFHKKFIVAALMAHWKRIVTLVQKELATFHLIL